MRQPRTASPRCSMRPPRRAGRSRRRIGDHALSFQHSADILEDRTDPALRKSDLPDAVNVGELLAPFFEQDDRAVEAELALEQAGLMHDVFTRSDRSVHLLVL